MAERGTNQPQRAAPQSSDARGSFAAPAGTPKNPSYSPPYPTVSMKPNFAPGFAQHPKAPPSPGQAPMTPLPRPQRSTQWLPSPQSSLNAMSVWQVPSVDGAVRASQPGQGHVMQSLVGQGQVSHSQAGQGHLMHSQAGQGQLSQSQAGQGNLMHSQAGQGTLMQSQGGQGSLMPSQLNHGLSFQGHPGQGNPSRQDGDSLIKTTTLYTDTTERGGELKAQHHDELQLCRAEVLVTSFRAELVNQIAALREEIMRRTDEIDARNPFLGDQIEVLSLAVQAQAEANNQDVCKFQELSRSVHVLTEASDKQSVKLDKLSQSILQHEEASNQQAKQVEALVVSVQELVEDRTQEKERVNCLSEALQDQAGALDARDAARDAGAEALQAAWRGEADLLASKIDGLIAQIEELEFASRSDFEAVSATLLEKSRAHEEANANTRTESADARAQLEKQLVRRIDDLEVEHSRARKDSADFWSRSERLESSCRNDLDNVTSKLHMIAREMESERVRLGSLEASCRDGENVSDKLQRRVDEMEAELTATRKDTSATLSRVDLLQSSWTSDFEAVKRDIATAGKLELPLEAAPLELAPRPRPRVQSAPAPVAEDESSESSNSATPDFERLRKVFSDLSQVSREPVDPTVDRARGASEPCHLSDAGLWDPISTKLDASQECNSNGSSVTTKPRSMSLARFSSGESFGARFGWDAAIISEGLKNLQSNLDLPAPVPTSWREELRLGGTRISNVSHCSRTSAAPTTPRGLLSAF